MALHIPMNEKVRQRGRRMVWRLRLAAAAICLSLLLLFGGMAYFTVFIIPGNMPMEYYDCSFPREDELMVDYHCTLPGIPASTGSPATPAVTPRVVVAQNTVGAAPDAVCVAPVEELYNPDVLIDLDLTEALGEGLGVGCYAIGPDTPWGSALQGRYYDLKLTRAGAPSEIPNILREGGKTRLCVTNDRSGHAYAGVVARFIKSGFDAEVLKPYYCARKLPCAACWYLPSVLSAYAPKAFECEEELQPGGWLCVYRGRVRAPKSGTFRFVGAGDEFIAVRFERQLVLEAGYHHPTLWQKDKPDATYTYGPEGARGGGWQQFWAKIRSGAYKQYAGYELMRNVPGLPRWNRELGGLTAGKTFEVKEGQIYHIEIAVGDMDGRMGFALLIEDMEQGTTRDERRPDLFRTNFSNPMMGELAEMLRGYMDGTDLQAPPYNEDSPIWMAVP